MEQTSVAAESRSEEPPGSSGGVHLEEPGGSSESLPKIPCALCRVDFLKPELQERTIRDQVFLVCSDCVTAHPKGLPKQHGARRQAGEKRRLA
eukprot:6455969-Amphidinium_carterae.1